MDYDVIVVGGGIAGLTSAAFQAKSGHSVLLLEKNEKTGGLVNSFTVDGFTFDGGIRAIENSGVLFPMLRQLGLDLEFVNNTVSLGFKDDIIMLDDIKDLKNYGALLKRNFTGESENIDRIINDIEKTMGYMDILYGIDNPIFLDMKKDRKYLLKVILPWMFKYLVTVNKIERLKIPIEDYLKDFTKNTALIDIISQHFFNSTPAFFALGYFKIYLDYFYPNGGTGIIPKRLSDLIIDNSGVIKCDTEVVAIDSQKHLLKDSQGDTYSYKNLIWAADLKQFYKTIDTDPIYGATLKENVLEKKKAVFANKGGESVLSLYLGLDISKKYFSDIHSEHFFYTPSLEGITVAGTLEGNTKQKVIEWFKKYLRYTTYEISIPVLRDDRLAPEGKTGLIISVLFDYGITKKVFDMGWYDEFKQIFEETVIDILEKSIYPGFKEKIDLKISSTPLTYKRIFNNSDGAITGWSFENENIPVETRLARIAKTPLTPFSDIFQAGQWSFSPSGLPTAIMTGKMASDRVAKRLKK